MVLAPQSDKHQREHAGGQNGGKDHRCYRHGRCQGRFQDICLPRLTQAGKDRSNANDCQHHINPAQHIIDTGKITALKTHRGNPRHHGKNQKRYRPGKHQCAIGPLTGTGHQDCANCAHRCGFGRGGNPAKDRAQNRNDQKDRRQNSAENLADIGAAIIALHWRHVIGAKHPAQQDIKDVNRHQRQSRHQCTGKNLTNRNGFDGEFALFILGLLIGR